MIRSKADKIREYAQELIENGTLDLARISNRLIRQMALDLTRAYGEEFKPNTVKQTLYNLRSRQPRHEEPEPEEEPPPATQAIIQHETPPPPTSRQPPPLRFGRFNVREKPDGTADIHCPSCGLFEPDYPLPVKTETITEQVEVIPKGYIEAPHGGEDWLRFLSLKHPDGKGIEDCPNCAKVLLQWFNQNKAKLEKAAGVKKSDIIDGIIEAIAIGAGIYEALNRLPRPTGTQPNPVTANLQPLNLKNLG